MAGEVGLFAAEFAPLTISLERQNQASLVVPHKPSEQQVTRCADGGIHPFRSRNSRPFPKFPAFGEFLLKRPKGTKSRR